MRVLLVSTYELGHQPLQIASPAAVLTSAGHQVRAIDLAVDALRTDDLTWAEGVAISVPMHTAMRLATTVAADVRRQRPGIPMVMFGLYAGMGGDSVLGGTVDAAFIGEYEPALVEWADDPSATVGSFTNLSVGRHEVPRRDLLPQLDRYAHLEIGAEHRLVGYVEASHGCRHRCRHCPIPAIYDGVFRIVGVDVVLADVANLVAAGARHITFGDPDFLNAPVYAMRVLEAVHGAHPELTFDLTIKVEHLLRHADIVARLPELNVIFVVSAFETVDDHTLRLLDKGHTLDDMREALGIARSSGIEIRPSWMPFTPTTTIGDVRAIFAFLDEQELLATTDPVQMSIRLLVPAGSLVLDVDEWQPFFGDYDSDALTHRWSSADPRVDDLQRRLAAIAEKGAAEGDAPVATLVDMWRAVLEADGRNPEIAQIPSGSIEGRPRLTEPWFC